jgi:hypothetical protein
MRHFRIRSCALLALLLPIAAVAQESSLDPLAWRAEVATARARADQHRTVLKAEHARNKALRALEPRVPDHVVRARMASDQAFNDMSLQRGDIVSTLDGLFVFNGDEQGVRSRLSFSPAGPLSPATP